MEELTVRQAGKKGGDKTKEKFGSEHYKKISKMGLDKRWGKKIVLDKDSKGLV